MAPIQTSTIPPIEILNLLCSLRHRAEKADDLSSYLPSFVPVIDLTLLGNRNTQVIYGRNGTGKTHILKCFEEISFYSLHSSRVLPIYFDMRMLNVSRISPSLAEEDIIEIFFSNFLYSAVEKIERDIARMVRNPYSTPEQLAWLNSVKTQSAIKAAIKRLKKAFNQKSMRERIDGYTKNIKSSSVDGSSAAIEGGVSQIDPSLSLKAGLSRGKTYEESVEIVIKGSHFIDLNEVREGFNDLKDALDLDQITFLIDEWSQIDVSIQPIFSELIRRTIGTSNNISCKFAALKFMTAFTTVVGGRRIGLQPGIDITELTDLNHIFTFDLDREAVRHFLIYILIKHLLEEMGRKLYNINFEDSKKAVIANVSSIYNRLFSEIFESKDAFDYFVRASEGNPRDFLAMIAECCATHGVAQLPITLQAVQSTAISYFKNTKVANFPSDPPEALNLFNSIFDQCLKNKSKIFSVSKNIDGSSTLLRDLWSQRVIHLIDNQYEYFDAEEGRVFSYAIYAVDYGKILGLRLTTNGGGVIDGLLNNTQTLVNSLYDGSTHRAILEGVEKDDNKLSALRQILGAAPANDNVLDQTDIMKPEVVFENIKRINVDNIVEKAGNAGGIAT